MKKKIKDLTYKDRDRFCEKYVGEIAWFLTGIILVAMAIAVVVLGVSSNVESNPVPSCECHCREIEE